MKVKWIILIAAGAIAAACWGVFGFAFFNRPEDRTVWIAIVTAAAVSLEAFFWVGAGVLGWSFLEGRRKLLRRWFGGRAN